MDDDLDRARHGDDRPGPCAVLRWARPHQKYGLGADAGARRRGARDDPLGHVRLQPRLRRRRQPVHLGRKDVPRRRHRGFDRRDLHRWRRDPRIRLHRLPDDLLGDHRRARPRRARRAHEILGGDGLRDRLADHRLLSDRAHGLVSRR